MEQKTESSYYKGIGERLIQTQPELAYLRASNIKIAYLGSTLIKKEGRGSKTVYAETEIIPEKYKWGIEADAAITIYTPNAAELNDKQRQILIFQQLLKIGVELNAEAVERYVLNDYDVNDFKIIIKKFGADWLETQKDLFEENEEEQTSISGDIDIFN